ncbi:VanZ family protein [Anaeromicropila herbilytica]|uniref:VanZ-like domain-containing protein n=1 Tax=Anaeromicropila herbilytica TaxID=2785025 RepID=A0A7R7EJU0_9FIRM|nr:VanZ family protein [Anaeromicropila herbilytica]BCN30044.1 hypothetical protein bsdtb5_13390 [Anaeromicropila herbilytica]
MSIKMKYLSFIPAIVIMCIIFIYSSKTAVESEHASNEVTYSIINVYNQWFHKEYTHNEKEKIVEKLDFIVRKMAHATEYLILALSVAFPLTINGWKGKRLFIATLLICIFYASTDEFHQLFVSGRSGQIRDVCIDGTGAFIGTSIFVFIRTRFLCRKKSEPELS